MTQEEIKKHCRDCGNYPYVFPLNAGMDLVLSDRPEVFPHKYDEPRKVKIKITSFIGSCAWAMHYYFDIEADGCHLTDNGNSIIFGHISEEYQKKKRDNGLYEHDYKIPVVRPITEQDIKDDPDYDIDDIGWADTNRFNTKEEGLEIAKEIVSKRFPGWELVIDDMT